jgi:hypothetical protein
LGQSVTDIEFLLANPGPQPLQKTGA